MTALQQRRDRDVILTFADTFVGVHLGAIFHDMNGKVDLGQRPLLADSANGIVDLLVAALVERAWLVGVHDDGCLIG